MDRKNAKRLIGSREDETDDSEIKSMWVPLIIVITPIALALNALRRLSLFRSYAPKAIIIKLSPPKYVFSANGAF